MKPNPNIESTAAPLERIRSISRGLKLLFFIFYIVPLLLAAEMLCLQKWPPVSWYFEGVKYASAADVPGALWLVVGLAIGLYLWTAVTIWQLLNLYEKGIIFSRANVRLYQRLGRMIFSAGLLQLVARVIMTKSIELSPNLAGLPWILGGLVGMMIAAIMEEGCKLREESDLTV